MLADVEMIVGDIDAADMRQRSTQSQNLERACCSSGSAILIGTKLGIHADAGAQLIESASLRNLFAR